MRRTVPKNYRSESFANNTNKEKGWQKILIDALAKLKCPDLTHKKHSLYNKDLKPPSNEIVLHCLHD